MHKIDLITGFLGSGKTTFIREYALYRLSQGERICILENDFGAINVDRVLLNDMPEDRCGVEMIIGGDTLETHRRRLKTKLIAMAMNGYERVIIEPSGVFDTDELFDLLYEEPLDGMYELSNIITIVDATVSIEDLSLETRYLYCAQCACAGRIIVSKSDMADTSGIKELINSCLEEFKCKRIIGDKDIMTADLRNLTTDMIKTAGECGYVRSSHVKLPVIDTGHFESCFCYHFETGYEDIISRLRNVFNDPACGHVFRIKGYMNTTDMGWMEINANNAKSPGIKPTDESENVLIVIGEELDHESIRKYIPILF